jgi:hypothetical protein
MAYHTVNMLTGTKTFAISRTQYKGRPFWSRVWVLAQTIQKGTPFMTSSVKYIGIDVHKESISIAVRNSVGKVVMESVIETKA